MTDEVKKSGGISRYIPLAGAVLVGMALSFGLSREDPNDLPSTFIDKPAPATALEPLLADKLKDH